MDQEGVMMMMKGKRTKRSWRMALTSSDEEDDRRSYGSAVTEEEHDMANCLILLARGGEEKQTKDGIGVGGKRKVAEIGGGSGGGGCYECKTCNKTFASFQALGGHRTSHRKIKSEISVSGSDSDVLLSSSNCSISLQISTPPKKTKNDGVLGIRVHQCSICGSEFSSGQALGGHMRRHREIPIRFSAPASSMADHQSSSDVGEVKTTRSFLSLDLNLPAPEDCEISQNAALQRRETTTLVCAPHSMVVGCHY